MTHSLRASLALSVAGLVGATPVLASVLAGDAVLERCEYRRVIMGVEARITLYATDADHGRRAAAAAFERMAALDAIFSDWRSDSELMRLVGTPAGRAVPLGAELFALLSRADALSRATDGAFDVTVGPLVALWRDARRSGVLPTDAALESALARVGYEKLELDEAARSVRFAVGGMQLDLGAIAKGSAAQEALDVLVDRGVTRALVDLGGDLCASGPPPGRDAWRVGVQCAQGGAPMAPEPLELVQAAVATSGASEQHLDVGGRRLSHVIDPRTGRPVEGHACATVIAEDGASADALASALSVLGPEAGPALVARVPGARALVRAERPWRSLFDGATLTGWTEHGGRYDGDADWSVEDGAITGRMSEGAGGGLLYTEEEFSSFELELETRVDHPFDSGIFVRMVPPAEGGKGAQVTIDDRPGGEIAAIYADGFLAHNTETELVAGEWNHFRVRCTGFDMRLEVWLNGTRVMDHAIAPNTPGFAPRGKIGVQVHGGRDDPMQNAARFRNIRIRELPAFDTALFTGTQERLELSDAARAAGWTPLFPESGFEGLEFVGAADGYELERRVLRIPAHGGSGHVVTAEDFQDFRLRVDFKLARMANSGLFLRGARDESDPAYSGCELQMLDDFNWEEVTSSTLRDYQKTGGLYAARAPEVKGVLRPIGAWNTYEVEYRGARLAVALNGTTLYDVDTHALENARPPFAERAAKGFLGFQRYGSPNVTDAFAVTLRNAFVQRLD